jgi:uridine kinase
VTSCIIAIAGPSGSGKSRFAANLLREVERHDPALAPLLLTEDAYYRDQSHLALQEREAVNYDHPDAIEQDLLREHLDTLRRGHGVDVPSYDYTVHTRCAATTRAEPSPVIIVEGILLLSNPRLREAFDIRFFLDTPLDICLLRRIRRDMRERGRSLESIAQQYESTVRPMHEAYIAPSAAHADMAIKGGGDNPVALRVVCDMVLRLFELRAQDQA